MKRTIVGLFARRTDAEDAADLLKAEGYKLKDISVVMKDKTMEETLADDTTAMITGGAITGVTAGTFIGGFVGLIGSYILPGLGAFLIGGPIAALLGLTGIAASVISGAATGAIAGGLIGALVALGLSVDEARAYEQRIAEGAVLLAVSSNPADAWKIESIFKDSDAEDVKTVVPDNFEPDVGRNDEFLLPFQSPALAFAGAKGGKMQLKGGSVRATRPKSWVKGSRRSEHSGLASGNVAQGKRG